MHLRLRLVALGLVLVIPGIVHLMWDVDADAKSSQIYRIALGMSALVGLWRNLMLVVRPSAKMPEPTGIGAMLVAASMIIGASLVGVVNWAAYHKLESKAISDKLAVAAEDGDLTRVRALIAAGADLRVKDRFGNTPLMTAARSGNPACVQALLDAGANVNERDNSGDTALMSAAEARDAASAKVLIDAHADVNAKGFDGWTALFHAARSGGLDRVKALLAAGADADARNDQGVTALECCSGDLDVIKALIAAEKKAGPTEFGIALVAASEAGDLAFVKSLIVSGADVKGRNGSLALEMSLNHRQIWEVLRAAGAR